MSKKIKKIFSIIGGGGVIPMMEKAIMFLLFLNEPFPNSTTNKWTNL